MIERQSWWEQARIDLKRQGLALAAACTLMGGEYGCRSPEHVVVQYDNAGHLLNCWHVTGQVYADEGMLHLRYGREEMSISGVVSSVPVQENEQFEDVARALGVDPSRCTSYPPE